MADNTLGEKELRNDWPFTSGITANTKHEDRQTKLIAEDGSLVSRRKKELID